MNLSAEDKQLLDELCGQNGVSREKVLKLLQIISTHLMLTQTDIVMKGDAGKK